MGKDERTGLVKLNLFILPLLLTFSSSIVYKFSVTHFCFIVEQRPILAAPRPREATQSPPGGTTPTRELEQMDVLSESFTKTVQVKKCSIRIRGFINYQSTKTM